MLVQILLLLSHPKLQEYAPLTFLYGVPGLFGGEGRGDANHHFTICFSIHNFLFGEPLMTHWVSEGL